MAGDGRAGRCWTVGLLSLLRCCTATSTRPRYRVHIANKTDFHSKNFFPKFCGNDTSSRTHCLLPPKSRFDCAIFPTHHIMRPDDHQDDMQLPCPPQHIFSVYVLWPVSRHSEPPTPETDENRLSAHVTGRPRPRRRLQLQRKVTTQSSKWEIAHIWRIERSLRWKYRAAAWQ